MARRTHAITGIAVAALLAALTLAWRGVPARAVANGEDVPSGRYRFAVQLSMPEIPLPEPRPDGTRTRASSCSGAIVSRSWVITAGHCFRDVQGNRVSGPVPYRTSATVGRTDLSQESGYTVDVVEVRQAPTPELDVALVRLRHPVFGVRPIGLTDRPPAVGQHLRLTGWGLTDPAASQPATRLQTGVFTVSSIDGHVVHVQGVDPAPNTSACAHDSGAPYFTEHHGRARLVSVENGGPTCPHTEPERTHRIDRIVPWIQRTVRGGTGPDGSPR
jgi:hypothetical protein